MTAARDMPIQTLPSRGRLIAAFCIALIFAIPMVTLITIYVVFPILFYAAVAIFVNVGLLAAPFVYVLDGRGVSMVSEKVRHKWIMCSIIWTGCAVGIANWGSAGAAIGATDTPFLKVFFAPVVMLMEYLSS